MAIVIGYIIIGIIAFIMGFIVSNIGKKKPIGTLRIDNSEPDEDPLLFLEIYTNPKNIMNEKQVLLDVNTKSYLSQD